MKDASIIHISEPCPESWNNMKPSGNGRFCDSCSMTVADFTKMTNEEITGYFLKKKDEHICGRYRNDQISTPKLIQRRKKWGWLVISLTFIFGASFLSSCRKHVSGRSQGYRGSTNFFTPEKKSSLKNNSEIQKQIPK